MKSTNRYKETTGECGYRGNGRRETECFVWEGTDESNKQSYPGLVQGYVDKKDLEICQKVI